MSNKIYLKPGKEQPLSRRHPWVFSGAIRKKDAGIKEGDQVAVYDAKSNFLGKGHFQEESISVRIISFDDLPFDQEFWKKRLEQALQTRNNAQLPAPETDAFRLVHAEGDSLSGLIIDIYGNTAVMQTHSLGMYQARKLLSEALLSLTALSLKTVYLKVHKQLQEKFPEATDQTLAGELKPKINIQENGVRFLVDIVEGQKTGFFLDQRDSRALLGSLSRNKKVLNTFAYTGGFSLYALKGGATLVHSVDASAPAIAMTEENTRLNQFTEVQHEGFAEDTFRFLEKSTETYDIIVLDPPAFAKHRNARHSAVRGYQKLNYEAIRRLPAGGLLFTFSCSQVVDTRLFYNTIAAAAIQAGREIKILYRLSQPADHPVSVYHPEGEYLKGLVLEVK
jgi:23S rRNA (cytosine1962-C5)-methyltransferase